jgi:two-component sensor histidine kinase
MKDSANEYRPSLDPWLILREMSHRVFNEFTAAICAVSAAAAEADDKEVKSVLGAVSDRLHSYAQIQRALEVPSFGCIVDASAHLRQLLEATSRAKLSHCGIELVFIAQQIELNSERCWRLGLIVSELITNATRHGLKERHGKVCIELLQRQALVECRVADNGVAPTEVRPGRGLEIIQALAVELEGRLDQYFGSQGSVSVLTFPIDPPTVRSSRDRPSLTSSIAASNAAEVRTDKRGYSTRSLRGARGPRFGARQ